MDRARSTVAVVGSFLLVLALSTLGWILIRPGAAETTAEWKAAAGTATSAPTTTPATAPTSAPPSATPTPTKSVKPTPTKKVVPKPTATGLPPAAAGPPAPKADVPGCTPTHVGTDASKADAKAALTTAAAREYWVGVVPLPELTVPRPKITVPADLIKGLAWQESGWQSSIVACDGGIGLVQVQPETVDFVNLRFGEDFDPHTLAGNTAAGAAYLEYLIMYFGLYYFGQNFELSTVGPVGKDGAQVALLDAVLAGYNVGPGTIQFQDPTTKVRYLAINEKGQQYANNVKALRTSCPCQSY